MFYLRREREEREAGRSEEAALAAAAATSGRAVMVSGFTVMIAMAGHVPRRGPDLPVVRHRHDPRRRGGGGRLADRAARRSWPGSATGSRRAASRSSRTTRGTPARARLWSRVLNPVLRHPVISLVARRRACWSSSRFPAFSLHTANPERRVAAAGPVASIKTYNRMQDAFPGGPIPAVVAVSADDVTSPAGQARRSPTCATQAAASPQFKQPITIDVSPDRTVDAGRASRWPATAPTRSRTRRWPSCATRSSRRRSARCRASRPT